MMLPRLSNARCCLLLFMVLSGASCRSSSSAGGVDAGSKPKIVRPRVTAPNEVPLDIVKSKLTLTMVKDRVSPVNATLTMRDGALALDGATARLSVDLDTFDSDIAIRNERVRNLFFETSAIGWESADLSFALPSEVVAKLRADKRVSHVPLEGTLKVHGGTSKLPVIVDAGDEGGKIWVKSSSPIVVKISDLGLGDNLRRLNAICMHDSIDDIVKVDVSLEFSRSH